MPAKPVVALGLLLSLQSCYAAAQEVSDFPSLPVDARILRVQDQADEIFERTDYERAFFIYRNELAPIGDKYAQYMVGFMYLTGKGVAEDRTVASAWYRLAAERGIKELSEARDQLMLVLDEAERARSDTVFLELRRQYGDLALLMRQLRDDHATLLSTTGSRLSAKGSQTMIVGPDGLSQSGSKYFRQIEKRYRNRLDYIVDYLGIEITERHPETVDLNRVERQVEEFLAKLD